MPSFVLRPSKVRRKKSWSEVRTMDKRMTRSQSAPSRARHGGQSFSTISDTHHQLEGPSGPTNGRPVNTHGRTTLSIPPRASPTERVLSTSVPTVSHSVIRSSAELALKFGYVVGLREVSESEEGWVDESDKKEDADVRATSTSKIAKSSRNTHKKNTNKKHVKNPRCVVMAVVGTITQILTHPHLAQTKGP